MIDRFTSNLPLHSLERTTMIKQIRAHARLPDILRLIRVEDYGTFIQLIIGYVLAGSRNWLHLAITLAILVPCIYGGLYALNDVHDVSLDRLHPRKRTRPVAAGRIHPQVAFILGVGLISLGVSLAFLYDFKVFMLALLFMGINLAYTFWLKSVPYVEIAVNTITHPLRFIAGLWLAGSWVHWTLLAAWTLAAFALTTLKRVKEMKESSAAVRPVLRYYEEAKLKTLMAFCLGLLIGMWPFTHNHAFVLTGIWITLASISVLGYFHVPAIKRFEEYLWR
jgi:decaprenyl-phosphate phosphoribosyltransferase